MKNILVAKFGGSNGRICFGKYDKNHNLKPSQDITSGCTEAKTIIRMLHDSGFKVSVLTKVLKGDYIPEEYDVYNVLDLANQDIKTFLNEHHFDYMLIINGSINCFGGAEEAMIPDLCIYKVMHYFSGKVFYCQCDLAINMLYDVYDYISKKPWASKYHKEDYDLSNKDIYMITQAHDLDVHMKCIIKNKYYPFKRENVFNFSFEKYPTIMPFAYVDKNETPEYDLGYGGTLRGGRRIKKLVKMYFNRNVKVHLYGKTEDDKLIEHAKKTYGENCLMPTFSGTCNFMDNGKILNKSLATVVIGDDIFEKTQTVQQRAYQAMCANVVTFIDEDLDKNHVFFKDDEFLNSFMYVHDPKEIDEKINKIKNDIELRNSILEKQKMIISFDKTIWKNELKNIIESV